MKETYEIPVCKNYIWNKNIYKIKPKQRKIFPILSILFLLQNNILQKVSNNYREKIVHRK